MINKNELRVALSDLVYEWEDETPAIVIASFNGLMTAFNMNASIEEDESTVEKDVNKGFALFEKELENHVF